MISANARAALRWRSTLSENESVVNAVSGGPEKKLVFVRSEVGSEHLGERTQGKDLAYFQETAKGPPRPPARFPAAKVHTTGTYWT